MQNHEEGSVQGVKKGLRMVKYACFLCNLSSGCIFLGNPSFGAEILREQNFTKTHICLANLFELSLVLIVHLSPIYPMAFSFCQARTYYEK